MKRSIVFSLVVLITSSSLSCTDNGRARMLGGNTTIQLTECRKLLNITWKEGNDIWYLTRPFHADETPETYKFIEDSSLGLANGTVTIIEKCSKSSAKPSDSAR